MESSCDAYSTIQITSDDGIVEIRRSPELDASKISLLPRRSDLYIPRKSCRTTWPLELIRHVAQRTSFAWLCDVIARHEDAGYVQNTLRRQLFSYFVPLQFCGKRLLDFGCGTGASTLALASMLPNTEVVGVDLNSDKIDLARHINSYRGLQNVSFFYSSRGDQLPPGLGLFDFVTLCGVYEHLLPDERKALMPHIWQTMKSGASILVSRTPHRYSPYEAHSTGLWFVNYLPDKLTHWAVRHFARRNLEINRSRDWTVHLRGGVRGATEREIVRNLTSGRLRSARILQPDRDGLHHRAGLWLARTNRQHYRSLKCALAAFFHLTDAIWGTIPSPFMEVVIEKVEREV